jgi:AcrR family transcriptional regulator
MSPRRTDTRQRAIEVALDLFTEQGYDNTSLREIAERLGIRKASLYYHFASKEALLAGILESLLAPLDELVAWALAQPRSVETRQEVLRRVAALLQGRWSRWIRFAQENQPALRDHQAEGEQMRRRMNGLFTAIVDPDAEPRQQVRSLLALGAVYIGNLAPLAGALPALGIEVTAEELGSAAMDVAMELVDEA